MNQSGSYRTSNEKNITVQPETKMGNERIATTTWPINEDIILVKSINKQVHSRSQKPLKRIEIKDVGAEMKVSDHSTNAENNTKEKEIIRKSPKSSGNLYSINSDDLKIIEKKNPKEEKNTSNNNLISKHNDKNAVIDLSKNIIPTIESQTIVEHTWEVPKTLIQFYSIWNNLKSSKEKYKYLKLIDPQELPILFLNSLESEVFSQILEVLADNCTENKDPVANILENIANIKRFNTFVLFMTNRDKKSK